MHPRLDLFARNEEANPSVACYFFVMRRPIRFAGAVGLAMLMATGLVFGHAHIVAPTPRDTIAHKQAEAPCGPGPGNPTAIFKNVNGTIPVSWNETIDHTGCFVWEISQTGNDNNFQPVLVVPDPANASPMIRDAGIKLDGGFNCQRCTLRLRQIMGATPATCGPTTIGSAGTYYSCADIQIGDWDASTRDGATTPPGGDGGMGGIDGGSGGVGADGGSGSGGGIGDPDNPGDPGGLPGSSGGCAVQTGTTGDGAPYGGVTGIAFVSWLALLRKGRRKMVSKSLHPK